MRGTKYADKLNIAYTLLSVLLTLCLLITTIVVFNPFYQLIESLLLGTKFVNQNL